MKLTYRWHRYGALAILYEDGTDVAFLQGDEASDLRDKLDNCKTEEQRQVLLSAYVPDEDNGIITLLVCPDPWERYMRPLRKGEPIPALVDFFGNAVITVTESEWTEYCKCKQSARAFEQRMINKAIAMKERKDET